MATFPTSESLKELKNGSHTDRPNRQLPKIFRRTLYLLFAFALGLWYFDLRYLTQHALKGVATRLFAGVADKHKSSNITEGLAKSNVLNNTYGKEGVPLELNQCPPIPPNLVGRIAIKTNVRSLDAVENEFPDVLSGGHFRPKECVSRHRVAILIPYRNRAEHLKIFIYNLHKVLSRQQIDYGVFVIEQGDKKAFNRAMLLNIGFLESTALYDYQCFIFHDVDLVPSDDRNIYNCPEQARHMSVWVDNHSFVYYPLFFGGVSAVRKEHMLSVNGFSNKYWGWGAEDDDMAYRIRLLRSWRYRYKTDGLNSIKYKRLDMVFKKLYTWILVDLRGP